VSKSKFLTIFEWFFKNKRYIAVRRSRTALSGTRTIFSFFISDGKKYSDCLSAIFYTDRKKIASH